jgi:cytochrome c oxidase assembly protein subunit 15
LPRDKIRTIKRGIALLGVLLALQIIWGAFVAGLKAGFFANTFPLMGGRLVPATLFDLQPALRNIVENPITVQWLHRVLGTVLALTAIAVYARLARAAVDPRSYRFAAAFLVLIMLQYLLGVLTLILAVPVPLGVTHQAMAMLISGMWVMWLHHTRELQPTG